MGFFRCCISNAQGMSVNNICRAMGLDCAGPSTMKRQVESESAVIINTDKNVVEEMTNSPNGHAQFL